MLLRVIQLNFILFLASLCQSTESTEKNGGKLRNKRSVILLPANTSITVTLDLSMPVPALVQQSGFYNMRVPFRFFIPTYNQLTSYYGRSESREDQDNEIEQVHRQEQERANEERRFIYKNMESLLARYNSIICNTIIYVVFSYFTVSELMEWLAFNEPFANCPRHQLGITTYWGTL